MGAAFTELNKQAQAVGAAAAFEIGLTVAAGAAGVPVDSVAQVYNHPAPLSQVRRQAVYLAVTQFNVSRRAVARAAGLSGEAVARACRLIEDARDEPGADAFMIGLEMEAAR